MNKLITATGIIILIAVIVTIITFIRPGAEQNNLQTAALVSNSSLTTSNTTSIASTTLPPQTGNYTTAQQTELASLVTSSMAGENDTTLQITSTSSTKEAGVDFEFSVIKISGSGLSRIVDAQLTNTGDADAHNISVKIKAFSGDSIIRLNGEDYIEVIVGTIAAGDRIEKQIELNVSIIDGLKITQTGLYIEMTISSDEYSIIQSYDYQPN
jgi:hypothetical protein